MGRTVAHRRAVGAVDNPAPIHSQVTGSGLDSTGRALSRVGAAVVAWAVGTVVAGKSILGRRHLGQGKICAG